MEPNFANPLMRHRLSAILMKLIDSGKLTRKAIKFAIDDSDSGTKRLVNGERDLYAAELIDLVSDRDIDADVRLTVMNTLLADTGLRVVNAEAPESTQLPQAITDALDASIESAGLAKRVAEVCADRIVTETEAAGVVERTSRVRSFLDGIESIVTAHTARPAGLRAAQ